MQSASYDYLFKVKIDGTSCVGKSSTSRRYIDGTFQENYVPTTIGLDFRIKTVNYDNKVIKIQLWDVEGAERFRMIPGIHYRGCHGVLLMYDVTDRLSFEDIEKHLATIQKYALPYCITILLGNKIDAEEARRVTFAEGSDLADRLGLRFFEISAKSGYGVNESLNELIPLMVKAGQGKIETQKKDSKDHEYIQKLEKDYRTDNKERTCF